MEKVPEKSNALFNHILNAHHIWNSRIIGNMPHYQVWDSHEVSAWEEIHYENQRNSFEIITNAGSLDKRINYENSKGGTYSSNLQDILFHIINHSTHHRAQIAMDFRVNGLEPLTTDYIKYKR